MEFRFDLLPPLRVLQSRYPEEVRRHAQLLPEQGMTSAEEKQKALNALSRAIVASPALTVPIAQLFRPILPELIARITDTSGGPQSVLGEWEVQRFEAAASALSKLLHLAPHISGIVLAFFSRSPSLFERLNRQGESTSSSSSSSALDESFVELAKTAYRFLRFSSTDFGTNLWDWSPFFSLLTVENNPALRYYVLESISILLSISDENKLKLPNYLELAQIRTSCELRAHETQELALENALMFASTWDTIQAEPSETSDPSSHSVVTSQDLHPSLVSVCGTILPRRKRAEAKQSSTSKCDNILSESLVYTPTTLLNMKALALAVCKGDPILLEGTTGAGKTALIEELARLTGNQDIIKIHLGDQTDAKVLLGTYVCTEVPGEFRWQPGALTQAVREGRWIVIEDIDLAPLEILSVLIPLLETRKLFIPGRGEVIHAPKNFQLFATQTLYGTSGGTVGQNARLLHNFWTRVVVEPLSSEELGTVLTSKFPQIASLVPQFIETFDLLRGNTASSLLLQENAGSSSSTPIVLTTDYMVNSIFSGRHLSTRDLLKWCRRVNRHFVHLAQQGVAHSNITYQMKEYIYSEAIDCFCAMVPSLENRQKCYALIGQSLGIPPDRVQHFVQLYKPALNLAPTSFTVGRVSLPVTPKQDLLAVPRKSTFAHTKHSLTLLERLAQCLNMGEPALLVGETGTGKTSVVQYLADQLHQKLVVQNLSQQTDSADLLGGFKPVEMRILCIPLKDKFDYLFPKTFSRKANAKFIADVDQAFAQQDWKRFIILLGKSLQEVEKKFLLLDQKEEAQRKKKSSEKHTAPKAPADSTAKAQRAEVKGKRKAEAELRKEGVGAEAKKPKQQTKKKSAQKPISPLIRQEWKKLAAAVSKFEIQQDQLKNNFAFSFVEGTLVEAVRNGYWVLLDEINLATPETLESISSLLEGGSIVLTEKGDVEPIPRHPNFRVFGCMNPPTDIGKKNLPPGLRNRFTEFYVDELSNVEDLRTVVHSYIKGCVAQPPVDDVVDLYLAARQQAQIDLTDGANQRPHYSLRTLCRALEYAIFILPDYGFKRALYEGFCMSFLTQLNTASVPTMMSLIRKYLVKGMNDKQLVAPPKKPDTAAQEFVLFEQFWIAVGNQPVVDPPHYILTNSIRKHLANLARAVLSRKYPVLLQGPTSSGKTSMVEYLAKRTGHRFVRINNHEHTDLQEYLGTYISDPNGKLVFQEGILVEAVRKGYWVVLDELNLAPSEVLEALNRLLDDNHELFIPETQEIVRPHPHFMLFATQNPPGLYGGRKVLSRAFRNRFVELHIDDIPEDELKIILEKRCGMAPPYCEKLVAVLKDLQRRRQGTQVFAGKHGFITLRDLFRWAERRPNGYQQLAEEGYMLLAERLRNPEEKRVIKEVLEKNMKNVKLDEEEIYSRPFKKSSATSRDAKDKQQDEADDFFESLQLSESFNSMVWNQSMRRLFTLVGRCLRHKEPVLLVGETGCGKTSICQYFASLLSQKLHILNCHQHTETADFLGGLRPVRGKEQIRAQLVAKVKAFLHLVLEQPQAASLEADLMTHVRAICDQTGAYTVNDMVNLVERVWNGLNQGAGAGEEDSQMTAVPVIPHAEVEEIDALHRKYKALFAWYDGPLVQAMKRGDLFLIDEISLAEDSVLERLNSVLEPNRLLVLAEKGATEIEELIAHSDFRILATMNPGGDFGKKELSPAMRNRFTEIWVPPITSYHDLSLIVKERFVPSLVDFYAPVLDFVQWFRTNLLTSQKRTISLRDILSWVTFMNVVRTEVPSMNDWESYLHSACLVLLDGLSYGSSSRARTAASSPSTAAVPATVDQNARMKRQCFEFLIAQLPAEERARFNAEAFLAQGAIENVDLAHASERKAQDIEEFHLPGCPFTIRKGPHAIPAQLDFALQAPTTAKNVMRVLRGLQLHKPILLEGSPGVGKTSLCMAIAKASGHRVVRINLSEQTDMMDLLGSDLPVEGGTGGEFAWCDGIFLQALKNGDWVLLDELNLASQSVLEGLNSVLDHRATVYIPELQRSFDCPSTFRIFACQNPVAQGGGRKGLPKSFLNRFTQVYVDELTGDDLLFITKSMFSRIPEDVLQKMITFNDHLFHETMVLGLYGKKGSPWEFNLRDISRWCSLMLDHQSDGTWDPSQFVDLIYVQRMRTLADRQHVVELYNRVFKPAKAFRPELHPYFHITPTHLQIGGAWLTRRQSTGVTSDDVVLRSPHILQSSLNALENMMKCVEKGWMAILSGPTASGKTSLVRLLANLTGNRLREFSMNSSIDTTELLGGFEQIDLQRHKRGILTSLSSLVNRISELLLLGASPSLGVLQDIQSTWSLLQMKTHFIGQSTVDGSLSAAGSVDPAASHHAFDEEQYSLIRQLLEKTHALIHERGWNWDIKGAGVPSPLSLSSAIQRLKSVEKNSVAGCFEWMDGLLINALEEGDWILIDNVNFCNPTVLDRLNPLLENNGVLMVNERGLVDGEVKVITPHPNFRIFLAMDPQNGEISRAMRNRGIEISLLPHDVDALDTLTLLNGVGLPGAWLARLMIEFHRVLQKEKQIFAAEHTLSIRDLLHWASLTVEQAQRGTPLAVALREAMELVYLRYLKSREKQDIVRSIFRQHFSLLLHALEHGQWKIDGDDGADLSFLSPSLWPFFVSGDDYRSDSTESTVLRQSALFLHYILQTHGASLKDQLGDDAALQNLFNSSPQTKCSLPLPILQRLLAATKQQQPKEGVEDVDAVLPYIPKRAGAHNAAIKEDIMDQRAMVKRTDEEIGFAAAYVIENASHHDRPHRLAYLHALGGERGATFSAIVERLWAHPLVAKIDMARERLVQCCFRDVTDESVRETKRDEIRQLLSYQPLDVRANAPLLSKLWNYLHFTTYADAQPDSLAAERIEAWAHHLNLLHRLDVLAAVVGHRDKEEHDLVAAAVMSPIRLSYLFYNHKVEKSQLPHDVFALFWPFFELLDQGLEAHLVSDLSIDVATLESLVKQRNRFWDYLSSTPVSALNLSDLHMHWKFVFKHLQLQIDETAADYRHSPEEHNYYLSHRGGIAFRPSSGLVSITEKIVDMLSAALAQGTALVRAGKGKIAGRDLLWKRGGHPSLLRLPRLFTLEQQLYDLLAPFNADPALRKSSDEKAVAKSARYTHWKQGVHPLYYQIDEEFKRSFAEAIATLHWLDSSRASASGNEAVLESMDQISRVLQTRLAAFEDKLEKELQEEEIAEAALLEGERRMDTAQRNLRKIWSQLWPLLDHFSSRQELVLISKLTSLLSTTSVDSELREGIEALLPWVRSFVERGVARTSRSPEDFVPYQRLLWKYSSHHLGDNNETSDEKKKPKSTSSQMREELVELVQEMKFRYHARLWHNTYNDMSFLTPPSPNAPEGSANDDAVGKDSMGPPRIFQSVQSTFVLHLFADWRKSVSVDQHPQRVKQLHSLASLFRQSYVADLKQADWGILFSAFIHLIDSFRDTFPEMQFAALRDILLRIGVTFIPKSGNDEEDGINFAAREALLRTAKGERIDRDELAALLETSSDARFCSQIRSYLMPIVDLFLRKADDQHKNGAELSHEEESVLRGQLYVLLGLAQVSLLLPAQKVDPTAKYPTKLAQIEQAVGTMETEAAVRGRIEKLFTGREDNDKIVAIRKEIEHQREHVTELARKITIRPTPGKFGQLFDALHQFARTLEGEGEGSAYSMMRFFSGTDDALASKAAAAKKKTKRSRRGKRNQEEDDEQAESEVKARKLQLLMEKEELWQEKTHNFLSALHEKYAPHYNDILHPIVLAIHHVMFGLRMLRFAAPSTLSVLSPSLLKGALTPGHRRVLGDLVGDLASFPTVENLSAKLSAVSKINGIIAPHVVQSLLDARSASEDSNRNLPRHLRGIPSMVLRSALYRAYLHIRSVGFISRQSLSLLDLIFTTFDEMWRRMKEREREAQEKEAEFYKKRGKVRRHKIPNADEDEEEELEEMFPSFWNDFDDLLPLEEREQLDESTGESASAANLDGDLEREDIQEWEIHQLYSVHRFIHRHLSPDSADADEPGLTRKPARKSRSSKRADQYLTVNAEAIRRAAQEDALKTTDFIDVLELSYSAGAAVMRVLHHDAMPELDEKALGGHVVMMHQILTSLTERPKGKGLLIKKETKKRNKDEPIGKADLLSEAAMVSALNEHRSIVQAGGMVHDIYRDPNIPEVLLVREPLEELSQRLLELLAEFPGNALLEQLLKITRRILSFPITSPLMKVLTGLEFLHGKVNDWEYNAAKHVSLFNHMEKIGRLIGRWRRLELQSYPLIFYARLQSHQTNAEKWWFHLHSLLKYRDMGLDKEKGKDEEEDVLLASESKEKKKKPEEQPKDIVLETLDGFILSSNHGEFSTRLQLLFTFYEQIVSEVNAGFEREHVGDKSTPEHGREHVRNLLYNLYRYYSQFSGMVEDNLKRLREPLEKKVQDFIQLAKWDDLNYYALKSSSEKSHRTLNKLSRHLEDLLRQPVNALLEKRDEEEADPSAAIQQDPQTGSFVSAFQHDKATSFLRSHNTVANAVPEHMLESPVLRQAFSLDDTNKKQNRLPSLYERMVKICDRDILHATLPSRNQTAEQAEDDQPMTWKEEEASELEWFKERIAANSVALRSKDKPRMQKMIMIRQLLQSLQKRGLSHLTTAYDPRQKELPFLLSLPSMESVERTVTGEKAHMWDSANEQYYRCLRRMRHLREALMMPSKELNQREIQRMSGYAEHMLHLLIRQRSMLSHAAGHARHIASLDSLLATLQQNQQQPNAVLPPQNEALEWTRKQRRIASQMAMTLVQVSVLCEALKSPPTIGHRISGQLELVRGIERDLLLEFAWHPEPQRLLGEDDTDALKDSSTTLLVTDKTWSLVVANFLRLQDIANVTAETLLDASSLFPVPLAHSICAFLREVAETASYFRRWLREMQAKQLEATSSDEAECTAFGSTFSERIEAAINSILVAVQNLQHIQTNNDALEQQHATKQDADASAENQEEEEGTAKEGRQCHFVEFHGYFRDIKKGLNMKNVKSNVEAVITHIVDKCTGLLSASSDDSSAATSLASLSVLKDQVALSLLAQLYPLVNQYYALVEWYMTRLLAFHASMAKAQHMLSGLFLTLFTKGYCQPEEMQEGGNGEGEMKFEDDVQGTGMGDGTGKKDVSDQIENEDQLMGTNKEEKEENKEPSPEDDEDKGFDMEQDFDGEIENMPDKGDEKEEDEEEEEEEEELDREMGEIDSEDEEVVDEKLWGSEDEEEDNTRQDGKEKIDRDNKVDAEPEGEEEMVAKEDGEEKDQDKEDEGKDKQKKKDNKGKNQENEEAEDGDMEDDEDGKKDEQPEEDENEEGDVNDMEDLYEDKGKDVRKEEEFELPEDLELDKDEKGQDEEEGGMDEDEEDENEDEEGDEEKKDEDDVMNISDEDEMKEGQGQAENEDEGKQADEDKEEKEKEEEEGEQGEKNPEEEEKDFDPEGDDEKKGGMGGQEAKDDEEEEDKGDDEEEDEEADKNNAQTIEEEDKEEIDSSDTQPQGVMHETVRKSANVRMDEQQEDQSRPQDNNQADENAQESASADLDDRSQRWIKSMKTPQPPERPETKKKKRERIDPNPYRSEGDANRQWKERLRVMDNLTSEEEKRDEEDSKAEEDDQMDLEDEEEAETYEFMKEDDKDKEDAQTLAPADETQAKSIPQKDKNEEEESKKDKEDAEESESEEEEKENKNDIEEGEGEEERPESRDQVKEMRSLRMAKEKRKEKEGEEEEMEMEEDVEDLTKDDKEDDEQTEAREDASSYHNMPPAEDAIDQPPVQDVEITLLTPEQMLAKREELDREMAEWREKGDMVHAEKLWRGYEVLTGPLAQELCEQLRLILEPTLCTQMRGDYRTGKRLNMKKVIPYIASQFKKDKIWMRRTKPSKRTYQVMLAIDDSRSMFENRAGHMACQALTLMAKALAQLEVGQLAILRFGETSDVLHPFDTPFTDQSGIDIISHFTFKQENTNVVRLMESVVSAFEIEKHSSSAQSWKGGEHMQLLFVVSDGRFGTRGKEVKRWIREALKRNIFIVFIITDAARPTINLASGASENKPGEDEEGEPTARRKAREDKPKNDSSILELQTITINREGKPVRSSYMDTFPFPNYIILQDINALPSILADALRQWFELIQQKFSA